MSDQLYLLPEIDREATRKRVENALETARIYRLYGIERRETPVTPAYNPRYHGNTNKVSQATEDVAVSNADRDAIMKDLAERVERVVKRLRFKEREIILKTYLADDLISDPELWPELHVSRSTYYRIQGTALYNLAFMLRLEVYVDDNSAS
jgi:ArpU family phage transcriptional regulator